MKKQLFLLSMMLLSMSVGAQETVEIDGVWYHLDTNAQQAEVTYNPGGKYTGSVDIPVTVTYDGAEYRVTSIGNYAFYYSSSLTSVTMPNSVTAIGQCAFSYCHRLSSVTIPSRVTSIAREAFYDCSALNTVTIPNSVTTIGEYNQEIKGVTNVEVIPVSA